ncbi:hypothetical protein [Roseomonas harenae]|uniref:hypothetical protein n=1 Tax=Muricoccus harenae TaxID=2692566 RepID=UPI001331A3F2|nr:hypothetical protein [Roseomonas harenae]
MERNRFAAADVHAIETLRDELLAMLGRVQDRLESAHVTLSLSAELIARSRDAIARSSALLEPGARLREVERGAALPTRAAVLRRAGQAPVTTAPSQPGCRPGPKNGSPPLAPPVIR